ncbi:MAG: family 16 glycoside hydrolase [Planctomycetota bacterium]
MLAWATVIVLAQTNAQPAETALTLRPLFNGENLQGWSSLQGSSSPWTVRDRMIVCSGKPAGVLRTERQYENFVLELEWQRVEPGGSAGLFVWSDALPAIGQPFPRAIEVQMTDAADAATDLRHGDVLSIRGAHMTPDRPSASGGERCVASEARGKPAGEWNQYRVTCKDGTLKLECNGKEVAGGYNMSPRKGYISLGSDGAAINFRNLRCAELPAKTKLKQEQVAEHDHGFQPLLNGTDLGGWQRAASDAPHWTVNGLVLVNDGGGGTLWTEAEYQDFELILDWHWAGDTARHDLPLLLVRGGAAPTRDVVGDAVARGWNRLSIAMAGDACTIQLNGVTVLDRVLLPGVAARGRIGIKPLATGARFTNLLVRAR